MRKSGLNGRILWQRFIVTVLVIVVVVDDGVAAAAAAAVVVLWSSTNACLLLAGVLNDVYSFADRSFHGFLWVLNNLIVRVKNVIIRI